MDNEDLKQKVQLIVEEFADDDLFNYINKHYGLEDLLSVEDIFFQKLNLQQSYSTNQAAQLLERELTYSKSKSQALVNYLQRQDFHRYLGQTKRNGRYRYDYRLLFKMRMIFYLSNHGLRPSDISEILGEIVTTEIYSGNNESDYEEYFQPDRMSKLKMEIMDELFDSVEQEFSQKYKAFSEALTKSVSFQYKEETLDLKSETYEFKKSLLLGQQMFLEQNKALLETILTEKPKVGLLARLFGKSNDEPNPVLIQNIESIKQQLELVHQQIDETEEKREKIDGQKQQLALDFKNFKESLDISDLTKITFDNKEK